MRNAIKCLGIILSVASAGISSVLASDLEISSERLSAVAPDGKVATISLDVSWNRSQRTDVNCDGIWLFAKYRIGRGLWRHVDLNADSGCAFDYADHTPEGFAIGTGEAAGKCGIWVPATRKGLFIFRKEGDGAVSLQTVRLPWNLSDGGKRFEIGADTDVRVIGVEMVHVPEGKHHVGDPKGKDGPDNCLYRYQDEGAYLIDSENSITVDEKPGALYCDTDNPRSRDAVPFEIPASFPKGFKAFWIMKYELSTAQYVGFLNMLTRNQQASRVASDISGDTVTNYYVMLKSDHEKLGQPVVCAKSGNGTKEPVRFFTTAPARACNFMSWSDIAAFADWAGLRPVTELEYEKACRGTAEPVPGEYAWGTLDLGRVDTFDGAAGSGTEIKVPQKGVVNCCFHGGIAPFKEAAGQTVPDNPGFEGPVSCGLFERSQHEGVSPRVNSGASFYGAMELTGNLWERCVTIGHVTGRRFTGITGDGNLTTDGFSDIEDWPGRDGAGAGNRGGVWSSPEGKYLPFALRFAANFPKSEDGKNSGCRLGF